MAATFPHLQFNNKDTVSTFKAGYNSANIDGLGLVHANNVHPLKVSTVSRQKKLMSCFADISKFLSMSSVKGRDRVWSHHDNMITQTRGLLNIFHIIHPQKQKRSVQPFCLWGEHTKGLSSQADVELDMINVLSAADNTFIMSSSQAIVNWLNALDQSDFSEWDWCIIITVKIQP